MEELSRLKDSEQCQGAQEFGRHVRTDSLKVHGYWDAAVDYGVSGNVRM